MARKNNERDWRGAPNLGRICSIPTVSKRECPQPVIVALDDIAVSRYTFTKPGKDGTVTLRPKSGGVLQGFRCKAGDATSTTELCGTLEPMDWLGKLSVSFEHPIDGDGIFDRYPSDDYGMTKGMPAGCIGLFPKEDGSYLVVGSDKTKLEFLHGNSARLENPNDCTGFSLSAYQPHPFMQFNGAVEVSECTDIEMVERLQELIKV